MSLLRLVSGHDPASAVEPPRRQFDLAATPLRPGVGHEELALVLDLVLAEHIERMSAATGLPAGAWAGLVVESQRALSTSAPGREGELTDALDLAAAESRWGLLAQRSRRLVRYGLALRSASPREVRPVQQSLRLMTTQHSIIAWELAATEEEQPVEDWAVDALSAVPTGRELWEAASAIAGQTLGEWVAVQAARRSSA